MNNKINKIDDDMEAMIEKALNEHLFKHVEKDDLINMMDAKFKSIHSRIDLLVGQPRMFNTLIDLNDDITKHEIEEAFDLFQH